MENTNIIQVTTGYKTFVTNHKACNNLNKRLRQYKDGKALYEFQEGEEGIFYFSEKDLLFVEATLKAFNCLS